MKNLEKILSSFEIQDSLNPKVWENPNDLNKSKLKPKIKEALEKISEEFIEYLGEDIFVDDVVLMGSLVNYNWSNYSDFDLHIMIDFNQFEEDQELYKELFDLKKKVFNSKHDIKIYGYDVELYAQGLDDPHSSGGIYSILNTEWLKKPKKEKVELDFEFLKKKIKSWVGKIDDAIESTDIDKMKAIKEKIKDYRKCGLEKNGELSYENLVFKYLRRSGKIEELFDQINSTLDKSLSIETQITEAESKLDIDAAISSSKYLTKLHRLLKNKFSSEYTPGQKIPFEPELKEIQSGLQLLGFSLPKWGVDGKFGPETEKATQNFQKSMGLNSDGVWGQEETASLLVKMIINDFEDEDLYKVKTKKESFTGNLTDKNFYEKLLNELGAPVTDENLKFLYAWRQSEGKGGINNPFNTTLKYGNYTNFNNVGVKNYSSKEEGLIATLKTLRNGRYNCIIDGLKKDIGAENIANCSSLEVWGTGDLVSKVLKGYNKGYTPKISPLS